MKVKLTLEWEFDQKQWNEALEHRNEMKQKISQVVGDDTLNAIYHLNGITYPEVKKVEIS